MKTLFSLIATALVLIPLSAVAEQKKLKVFILAGQSNMEGHAKVETFDSLAHDPATASLHKLMHGTHSSRLFRFGDHLPHFLLVLFHGNECAIVHAKVDGNHIQAFSAGCDLDGQGEIEN